MRDPGQRMAALAELRRRVHPRLWERWLADAWRVLLADTQGAPRFVGTPEEARRRGEELIAAYWQWARAEAEQRLRAAGLRPAAAAWLARRLPRGAIRRIAGG